MDRRKLKMEYKQNPPPSGVFLIKNLVNGKILIGSSTNSNGVLDRERFQLTWGGHRSRELQQDWDQFGPDSFSFEILEILERENDPTRDFAGELKEMETRWLERLKPYGDNGYNREPRK